MAESIENYRVRQAHDPDARYTKGGEVAVSSDAPHKLDYPEYIKKLSKLESWFEQERSIQAENRFQMSLDHDFYDGLQYSEEDAAELMERGQAPLVYNEIKPTIDWVVGTERRTKFDFNVLPRTDDDVETASVKCDVMKYISDVNRIPFERSQAFKETVICGLSWIEDGVKGDNDDDPLFSQHESWRNVWYDSNAKKLDLSDARYLFRRRVADLDVAVAMFPERASKLRAASMDQDSFVSAYDDYYLGAPLRQGENGTTPIGSFSRYGGIGAGGGTVNRRERVELIEAWVRTPARVQKIRGDLFDGEIYDAKNPEHVKANDDGVVSLFDALEMQIEVTIFCSGAVLWDGKSPYKHNRFSLTPMWCYRRGRDNAPYGIVRNQRDMQEDVNKRASKAQFILSSNQVIAEEGAVDDWDELRDEVSRPDGIIIKKKGKELVINQDKRLAEEHLMLMDRGTNGIRHAGGVTDENLGRTHNDQSGKAIIARQTQGSVVTAEVFDNYLLCFQISGENLLSLSEQYYSMPKVIRLSGKKQGTFEWLKINQPGENGEYLNDITKTKADFLVDEQDYRENIRQAMFEQMLEMVGRMPPEMAINLLDLVFEFSDLQGKDEIVARIRKLNGQVDDTEEKTPEALAQEQAKQQQEAEQSELMKRQAEANVRLLEAKVDQLMAQNEKIGAERLAKTVEAMFASLQAAGIVATTPGVAPVADEILKGSGFKDVPQGETANLEQVAPAGMNGNIPDLQRPAQEAGMMHGIQTPQNEGINQ